MRVLQFAKYSLVTLATAALALSGCGSESSAPTVPFNPAGATADLEAVNTTFGSQPFTSFSALSVLFDAALGGAPLVSASAAALDVRGGGTAMGLQAAVARSAERIARIVPRPAGRLKRSRPRPGPVTGEDVVYSGVTYVSRPRRGRRTRGKGTCTLDTVKMLWPCPRPDRVGI